MKLNKVLIFSEHASLLPELCAGANTLAEESIAVVLGKKSEAEALQTYAGQVIWGGEYAEGSMVEDYVPALVALIKTQAPDLVLIHSSKRGKCIAGRMAVRLNTTVYTDVIAMELTAEKQIQFSRMVYGGMAFAKLQSKKTSPIALVGNGIFEALPRAEAGTFVEMPLVPTSSGIVCKKVEKREVDSVDLGIAKRVVGVGRGIGEIEHLTAVEAFAKLIGAQVGYTRPVVEAESTLGHNYIGISGLMLRPDIYVACGTSGQIQHMVGVNDARIIIAINKDKNAPVFQNCDYGIVGDMNKIIPALNERLKP